MRAGQQCEYLATLLRTNSDAVGNGMTQQLIHRPLIDGIQGEIAVSRYHAPTALDGFSAHLSELDGPESTFLSPSVPVPVSAGEDAPLSQIIYSVLLATSTRLRSHSVIVSK